MVVVSRDVGYLYYCKQDRSMTVLPYFYASSSYLIAYIRSLAQIVNNVAGALSLAREVAIEAFSSGMLGYDGYVHIVCFRQYGSYLI